MLRLFMSVTASSPRPRVPFYSNRALWTAGACIAVVLLVFAPAIISGKVLAIGDGANESLPALYGSWRLWDPDVSLGYPLYADPSQAAFYPLRLLGLVHGFDAYVVFSYALASGALALYLCDVVADRLAAAAGAVSFALGGFTISQFGHPMLVHPAAWNVAALAGLERYRRSGDRRWLAGVSASITFAFLSGQPQIGLFGVVLVGAYALWFEAIPGMRSRAPLRLLCMLAAIALGVAGAAILLLPAGLLGAESTRNALSFESFLEDSLAGEHLARSIVYPYVAGGSAAGAFAGPQMLAPVAAFTEATIFLPASLVALAIAACLARPRAVSAFWMTTVALGFALAIGNELPLASWTFHWWPFDLFRLPGRHAFEITLGVSILAAFGFARLRAGGRSWRILAAAAGTAAISGGAYVDLAAAGAPFALASGAAFSIAAAMQIVALAICAVLRPGLVRSGIALASIAAGTGLFALNGSWRDAPAGVAFTRPPYAEVLASLPRSSGQRVYAFAADPQLGMVPNEPARWGVPDIAGYTPLSFASIADFLREAPDGRLLDLTTSHLQLAAVRYLAIPAQAGPAGPDPGAGPSLDLFLSHTSPSAAAAVTLAPPAPAEADAIEIVSALGASTDVAQGAVVARLEVTGTTGERASFALRAGIETAEIAYDRADVAAHVRHRRAPIYESTNSSTTWYRMILPLASPRTIRSVTLHVAPGIRGFNLRACALVDRSRGTAYRFGPESILYAAPSRFRFIARAGEIAIFESRTARPLAWVEDPHSGDIMRGASVRLQDAPAPSRRAAVRCPRACRVVFAERRSAEWNDRLDDRPVAPSVAHDVLVAIDVPAGTHVLESRYVPMRLWTGAAVTALSSLCVAALAFWPGRREKKGRWATFTQ